MWGWGVGLGLSGTTGDMSRLVPAVPLRTGVRICVGLHKQPPPVNPLHRGGLGRFPGQTGPTGAQYRRTLIMSYVNVNDINDIANCTYLWLYQHGVCCAAAWPAEAGPGRPGSPACARGGVSRGALNHPFASPLATPPHRVRGTSQRDLASIRPQVAEAHTSRSTGLLRAKENPARMLGSVEAG